MWTDDPPMDAELYAVEREKRRQERIRDLPECEICGFKIEEDYYYDFDKFIVCPDCANKHRVWQW